MQKSSSTSTRVPLNSLVKRDLRKQVEDFASEDNRSLSSMVEILLQEAIENRQMVPRKSA